MLKFILFIGLTIFIATTYVNCSEWQQPLDSKPSKAIRAALIDILSN
jgi:hypothetical protein